MSYKNNGVLSISGLFQASPIKQWTRICARLVDYSLFYFLGVATSFLLPLYVPDLFYVALALATPLLWAPVEAFWLSTAGYTPGKALFGIVVRTIFGKKLSFFKALKYALWISRADIVFQKSLSKKRKFLCLFILAFAVLGTSFGSPTNSFFTELRHFEPKQGWISFYNAEKGFLVDLPNDPELIVKEIPVAKLDDPLKFYEYQSLYRHEIQYSVGYIELPSKWRLAGSKRILNGALDIALQNEPGAELVSKGLSHHFKYPALDFHLKYNGYEVEGRLILIGRTLYKLTAAYQPARELDVARAEFIDSFQYGAKPSA